jgi:hypothetical protein
MLNVNETKVIAEASTVDGVLFMSRGRRGSVLVSREHAWSDVQAWQKNEKVNRIMVRRKGEIVWTWTR